jgi:predicted metal-dependent TIM-barrel fold hydrolase
MPADVLTDFDEARRIGAESPRGAAALLRLCVQKLCVALGLPGKNINEDVAALVKKGLPELLQQSLDAVRVIGNNAVHPGELNVADDPEIVAAMFGLVNIIVERMIGEPKHIREIYDGLPDGSKAAVERRDA